MAKYKNVSGADLLVPVNGGQRLVLAGGVLDDSEVDGHLDQPGRWEPASKTSKTED